MYGEGISWEGTVLDTGLERKVVQKSGSYFSYGNERLGQGRQNASAFLKEHPDVVQQILQAIQAQAPPEQIVSARLLPQVEPTEATPVEPDAEVPLEVVTEAPARWTRKRPPQPRTRGIAGHNGSRAGRGGARASRPLGRALVAYLEQRG